MHTHLGEFAGLIEVDVTSRSRATELNCQCVGVSGAQEFYSGGVGARCQVQRAQELAPYGTGAPRQGAEIDVRR